MWAMSRLGHKSEVQKRPKASRLRFSNAKTACPRHGMLRAPGKPSKLAVRADRDKVCNYTRPQ
jgi:hypothetical protein